MTKFLNESGFRRIIKTIKDALAGKQDKKLVVTVTGVGSDNITADKTYNEILSAYNNGADILVDDGYGYFYHLIAFDSGWFVFMMKPYDEANSDYYLLVSPQNVWTSRIWVAQEKLISGTNIKTVNNNSLLGSGNISIEPNEIASITTTESTASGGNNTVTINTTDGTSKTFNVKNGKDGADGVSLGEVALVQTTGDSEESVMSQKAVTEYGRKVTAEDLNGTSDWIRAKLTAEGWEFGKKLNNGSGAIATDTHLCISEYIPVDSIKEHSITFNLGNNINIWIYVVYDANKTALGGSYVASSQGTLTPSDNFYTTAAYIRFTLDLSVIDECYCYDNTTGHYIFKGDELISQVIENNGGLVDYGILQGNLVTQELGDSSFKIVSQRTITEQLETSHIFKTHYSNFAVSQGYNASDVRDGKLISVDTWNMAELKIITSLRLTDLYSGGTMNNYRHCHLLGIGNSLSDDYFSIYEQDYNWFIWYRRNGTDVLKYQIGRYNAYYRLFAVMDFYNKTISLYGYKNATNGNEILIDHYDFSSLDLSGFTNVHILTGYGASNSAYQYANWIEINNFIFDWEERLDLGKNMIFGSYNSLGSQSMVRGITTLPNEFMFTNESNTDGITVTLDEPYHKIVTVNRDTAELVYNVGFYKFNNSPSNYQSNVYEIFKVKFTNVTSNVLLRGWNPVSGASYIIDKNYNYTQIPMDTNTGTVLSYEVVEGDTYYIMYPIGSGYATRFNHYFGGHFTMEITEPMIYSVGRQNLVCQSYNGTYFEGYFPFKGVLLPTEEFGQFTTYEYPMMTGRTRINNGNIQVYNGSVWKQINNS